MSGAHTQAKGSWRDRLPVHPAADLFPPLSAEELHALAKDIDENGVRHGVTLHEDQAGKQTLIDGRNRLDALELLGRDILTSAGKVNAKYAGTIYGELPGRPCPIDFAAFTVSANIHRRHLTSEQKRELIAKLLKLDPSNSNRAIAAVTKANDKTIASVRKELQAGAEIPHLKASRGKDGKSYPSAPAKRAPGRATDPLPKVPGPKSPMAKLAGVSAQATSTTPYAEVRTELQQAIMQVIDGQFAGIEPHTVIDVLIAVQATMKSRLVAKAVQQ